VFFIICKIFVWFTKFTIATFQARSQ